MLFVILLASKDLVCLYCRYIPAVIKPVSVDVIQLCHMFYSFIMYVPEFLRSLLPPSSFFKMEAAGSFEILTPHGLTSHMSGRHYTLIF
jgi:hypothetical protein